MGRSFSSPAGMGSYLSVILRPECTPDQLMHLTCAAGLAARNAVMRLCGVAPALKWPNDLVVDGKKLETDDPFVTYGEYAELPLVAIMEALGAKLEWKYDDYVGITWGGNQCWIDTDYSSLKYGGQRFHGFGQVL